MKHILKLLRFRQTILFFSDIILINLVALLSLALRFDFVIPQKYIDILLSRSILYTVITILCFYWYGAYRSLWRYASIEELVSIAKAVFVSSIIRYIVFEILDSHLPRSYYIINMAMLMLAAGGGTIFIQACKKS